MIRRFTTYFNRSFRVTTLLILLLLQLFLATRSLEAQPTSSPLLTPTVQGVDTAAPAPARFSITASLGVLIFLAALLSLVLGGLSFLAAQRVVLVSDRVALTITALSLLGLALLLMLLTAVSASNDSISLYPLSEPAAQGLKLLMGVSGIALLSFNLYLRLHSREQYLLIWRQRTLVILGALGFFGYFNWGSFHHPSFTHQHEFYHYFIGAKYSSELGYSLIYDCTAKAEAEIAPTGTDLSKRKVRDLATNNLVLVSSRPKELERCNLAFSEARWSEFKSDIMFFKAQASESSWQATLSDHGFNATPVWNIAGSSLANLAPASQSSIFFLGLIDPLLLVVGFLSIAWAFGWEVLCVSALFFGIFYTSNFFWTGGAYLRQDWFVAILVGLALLKKNYPALAGASLVYAGFLRIFPFAFMFGPLLRILWVFIKERRIEPAGARFIFGAVLAVAILIPSGALTFGRASAYGDFIANSKKHITSPLTNNMGLATLVSFRPLDPQSTLINPKETDPFKGYKEFRLRSFIDSLPVYALIIVVFLALCIESLRREPRMWVLATFGFVLIPVTTYLTCYYYSFLTVAALLLKEQPKIALMLLIVAVASQSIAFATPFFDLQYAMQTLVTLAFGIEALLSYRQKLKGLPTP